jgi:hypothetical protein
LLRCRRVRRGDAVLRALAARDLAHVTDCSDLDWIDVDDARALAEAEAWIARTRSP